MDMFWLNVEKAEDGCWNWTGALSREGYGKFRTSSRETGAHRISWMLAGRPLAKGKVLHHRCENRRCVNPMHLQLMSRSVHAKLHHPFLELQHGTHDGYHNHGCRCSLCTRAYSEHMRKYLARRGKSAEKVG